MATLITGVNLYTGLTPTLLKDGYLCIGDDGRIESLSAGPAPENFGKYRVFDGGGATALPGLIDMHTHIMGATAEQARDGLDTTRVAVAQAIHGMNNLQRAIRHGITTVRDAGAATDGIFALQEAVEAGRIPGPRFVAAGSALTMTGGHGHPSFAIEADGEDGLRRAARLQMKAGAECIKLIASSGVAAPCGCVAGLQLNFREMAAAADEAPRGGYHTLAHAIPAAAVREALDAGVDSIEHGIFLDEETVRLMKVAGVHYTPTLAIFERIARGATPGHYPPHMVEKAKPCVEPHKRSFQMAVEAGIPILAGSDSGNWGWTLGDLADELVLMNRYGLPADRCLAAATVTAAEFLKKPRTSAPWKSDATAMWCWSTATRSTTCAPCTTSRPCSRPASSSYSGKGRAACAPRLPTPRLGSSEEQSVPRRHRVLGCSRGGMAVRIFHVLYLLDGRY